MTGRRPPGRRTAKPGAPGRVRGIGAGRKTRRNLERGGTGAAGELNEAVGGWPRVKITPMFGRWSYFVGPRLFGCFPLREKDTDLWIRLAPDDQRRALATAGVVPHRRLASHGLGRVHDRDAARRGARDPLAAPRLPGGGGRGRAGRARRASEARPRSPGGLAAPRSAVSASRARASMRSMRTSGTSSQAIAVKPAEIRTSGV